MKKLPILQLAMIVMLCVAMLPLHTYGYYVLLKFVICGGCGYLATKAFSMSKMGWVWALGITAVIYNPFVRFPLGRSLWTVVNVATIVLLAVQMSGKKK